jgi:hypothetical protein
MIKLVKRLIWSWRFASAFADVKSAGGPYLDVSDEVAYREALFRVGPRP